MSSLGGYALFAAAFAASVATPGPDILAVVGRALGGGARACLGLVLGIVAGKLTLLTLALLGLAAAAAAAAAALGPLFVAVKLAGAFYLVWLGVKLWRRPVENVDGVGTVAQTVLPLGREVLVGFAMALGNPVAVVFYVTLLPTVLDVSAVTPPGYVTLCGIVAGLAAAIMGGYALFAGGLRRVFRTASARRAVDRTAGTVMIGAGIAIAAR